MTYLSKSDFKTARDCPTKLYYKKMHYPNATDEDAFMRYLAEGGYMIGKLATLLYPNGISIETGGDHKEARKLTREYLKQKNVTLFEAAIYSASKLIRVDILEKRGGQINLIEVKSKSYDSTNDEEIKKKIKRELKDYYEDVAYQYFVLREAFPEYKIKPFLFLPDKSKRTNVEGLNLLFRIKEVESGSHFRTFDVTVDEAKLKEIRNDDIMTLVDVEREVLDLQQMVKDESKLFLESLKNGIEKIKVPLTKDCFKCEFTLVEKNISKSGFDECWNNLPKPKHHIKELYHIGSIGGYRNPKANGWIDEKKVSLFDIPQEELTKKRGERQLIQIKNTKDNTEWISTDLNNEIANWKYPLHFIDFETHIAAIPFHKNMRPYELIAFQWSCHTIDKPGMEPKHFEWINLEPKFPSFNFAKSLMDQIGSKGTPFMWATHENTVLKMIYNQMKVYDCINPELKTWLEDIVKFDKSNPGRFVDLNQFTLENYFHPMMKGKTSIKWVLPAVLSSYKSNRIENWLMNFENDISLFKKSNNSGLSNPYELLPQVDIYQKSELINEGTGAMRAYGELMFGLKKGDDEVKDKYKVALLKYCKLDTLSMVIIWEHWKSLSS